MREQEGWARLQTMNSERPDSPYLSRRSLLLVGAAASITGLLLVVLVAPFWCFYIAPIVMGPIMVYEFRARDKGAPEAGKTPQSQHSGHIKTAPGQSTRPGAG